MIRALFYAIAAPIVGGALAFVGAGAIAGFAVLLIKCGVPRDQAVPVAWFVVPLSLCGLIVAAMTAPEKEPRP